MKIVVQIYEIYRDLSVTAGSRLCRSQEVTTLPYREPDISSPQRSYILHRLTQEENTLKYCQHYFLYLVQYGTARLTIISLLITEIFVVNCYSKRPAHNNRQMFKSALVTLEESVI